MTADHDHAARWFGPGVPGRYHRGRRGRVDRQAAGQGRGRGRRRRRRGRPRRAAARRRRGGDRHRRHRGRAPRAAPLDGARDGPGRHAAVPGRQVLDRPGRSRTASTTTSSCPAARTFSDDDLAAIEARMREIIAADQPFVRSEVSADEALTLFADQPYKRRDHRAGAGRRRRCRRRARRRRGRRRRHDQRVPQHRRVRRPVPGPHVPVDRPARPLQADEGRRRLLAGQREGPDAAAHLRHGVGVRGRARRPPPPLEEAEKRDHRKLATELDLLSFPSELGGGLAVWHPKGAIVRKLMEDYSRERHERRRLRVRVHAAPRQRPAVRDVSGHLDWYADGMYPPMEMDNGTYYMKPMNCPMHCLIFRVAPAQLPRAAAAAVRARHGVPLRAGRHAARPDAHPRLHPGRQPHLLHARSSSPTRSASLLDFVLSVLRAFGFEEFTFNLSTKDPNKYVGSDEIWEKATDGAARGARARTASTYAVKEGDAAFYGPKIDIDVRDAIGRTWQLSHDPVRLQPSRALRARVRRRRQRPPPADHVAPRPVRLDRAVLRRAARALRRRVPDVAGAGAGARAAGGDGPRGLRRGGRRAARAPPACRVDVVDADDQLGKRIRTAKLEKLPVRARGRRRRRRRRHGRASTRAAARSSAACPSTSSCAGFAVRGGAQPPTRRSPRERRRARPTCGTAGGRPTSPTTWPTATPRRVTGSVFTRILQSGLADAETNIVHRGDTCFAILNAFPYSPAT